ncbi:MAG: signal peptidase I [Bdellovibrionales bacterium]
MNSDIPVRDASDGIAETIRTVIVAIIIAMIIRTFAFEPFNIPSSSMVPSLLIGDYLFVSKYSYGYGSVGTFWGMLPVVGRIGGAAPKRGDVIVFKTPKDNKTDYIKRLIGLPGDTVQVKRGILFVNGEAVKRTAMDMIVSNESGLSQVGATEFLEELPGGVAHVVREEGDDMSLDNTEEFKVPPGHYFFMGDNRDNSLDSRTAKVGYVPEENLVGRAEVLFFSLDEHAKFWEFWKWPTAVRVDRIFTKIE